MITSTHRVKVEFSPIKHDAEDFSNTLLKKVRGCSISSGSFSSYPFVEATCSQIERAEEIEKFFIETIEKHGGKVIIPF